MITNWTYIIFSYLSLFLLGLSDNIRGPLLSEIMSRYSLNHTQASFIFVTSSSMGFLASLVANKLINKYSILKVLSFSCVILSVGFSLVFFSNSYLIFLFGIALFGISMGFMAVSQNLMGSLSASGASRSKVISGLHSMYGLSSLLAPILVVTVVSLFSLWQYTFLIIAFLSLTLALPIYLVTSSSDQRIDDSCIVESTHGEVAYSSFYIWRDSLILASYVGAEILVSSRIATFSKEAFHYNLNEAANLTSLFFISLLSGRIVFTFFKSPLPLKLTLNLSLLISIVLLILGLKFDPKFLALTGLSMSFYYPFCISFLSEKYSKNMNRIISSAMILQSLVIVLMHLLVGHFSDLFGVKNALFLGVIFLLVPVVILFFEKKSEVSNG